MGIGHGLSRREVLCCRAQGLWVSVVAWPGGKSVLHCVMLSTVLHYCQDRNTLRCADLL